MYVFKEQHQFHVILQTPSPRLKHGYVPCESSVSSHAAYRHWLVKAAGTLKEAEDDIQGEDDADYAMHLGGS